MPTRLPTRAEILDLLGSDHRPMHVREIASRLRVSEVDYLGLERLLDSLSLEGVLSARPGPRFKLSGGRDEPSHEAPGRKPFVSRARSPEHAAQESDRLPSFQVEGEDEPRRPRLQDNERE